MAKNEAEVQESDVWDEHIKEVRVGAHRAYLFAVLIGGFLLMIALIALLGSSTGG